MKKKIIYSSVVLTALLSASSMALAGGPEIIPEPDYFSGLYVGGIGGVHHNTFTGTSLVELTDTDTFFDILSETLPGVLNTASVNGGGYAGYGGVQGGFGHVFNHMFYIGIQGWGEWGSTSETETHTLAPSMIPAVTETDDGTIIATQTATAASNSTTVKISNDYGLAAKLGWVVAPRSMIYGKVGASWANIKVTNSNSVYGALNSLAFPVESDPVPFAATAAAGSSVTQSDTKIGLLLGVGFEQFVYQDIVSVNVEANYTNYGHVNTPAARVTGFGTFTLPAIGVVSGAIPFATNAYSSASVATQVSSLMAGLNFYFGRNWF